MRRTHAVQSVLVLGALAIFAVAVATAGATGKATAGGHKATAVAASKAAVIRTNGREVFKPNPSNPPNKEDVVTLGWSPGTITVKSGQKLTLVDGDNFGDPHVLVISPKKDLPKADTPAFKNPVVRVVAPEVLNDPSNPDKGFKALSANRGKPGLEYDRGRPGTDPQGSQDLGDRVGQARHHALLLLRGPLLDAGQDHRQVALTAGARLGHGPGRVSRFVDQHADRGERRIGGAVQPRAGGRQLAQIDDHFGGDPLAGQQRRHAGG